MTGDCEVSLVLHKILYYALLRSGNRLPRVSHYWLQFGILK